MRELGHPTRRCAVGRLQCQRMGTLLNETEEAMASCEHLVHAEEQMRDLLCVINDHLKLYDPDEDTYGSLLSVAHHINLSTFHECWARPAWRIRDVPFENANDSKSLCQFKQPMDCEYK